jgi:hypothetical protein
LYKTHLTATVFKNFSSRYQQFTPQPLRNPESPFVYVDSSGVKLVTNVIEDDRSVEEGIFALSMAQDGFVEMLSLQKAS